VKYVHESIGFNRRLDTLQAAVLRVKLAHLDDWNAARRRHAAAYTERLAAVDAVATPVQAAEVESVFHLYPIRVEHRERVQQALSERGVSTVIHYPVPIHLQQAYSGLGYGTGDFPRTESLAVEELSLPMFPELSADQIDVVCDAVADAVGETPSA
jgi:dTDP-4-amino-4,6-dideoxygalactose transaminase